MVLAWTLALLALVVLLGLAVRSTLRQRAFLRRVGLPDNPHRLPFVGNVFHALVLHG